MGEKHTRRAKNSIFNQFYSHFLFRTPYEFASVADESCPRWLEVLALLP